MVTQTPATSSVRQYLRIAIVAENASAKFGGEAILPLHYFRIMRSRGLDVHLFTHERTRDELMQLLPAADHDRVHFLPNTWAHRVLSKIGRKLPGPIKYFSTSLIARLVTQASAVRRIRAAGGFDVLHQPTPVSPKDPSIMHRAGAPLIIGPLNGGMSYPPAFSGRQNLLTRTFTALGRLGSGLVHLVLAGKRKAAVILVANERTRLALPPVLRGRVICLVENGVDLALWHPGNHDPVDRDGEARFIFLGRLIDWKAVDLLLRAFAQASKQAPMRLEILGDGVLRKPLEAQARESGIGDRVRFHGWVAQADAARELRAADALVLPSLYECGGAVVLEAMACGLPVIATRWGGPADYLDETCGVLIDPASPDALVRGFADAMIRLAADPAARRSMGEAGRARIEQEFDWQRKVDRMIELYHSVAAAKRGTAEASSAPAVPATRATT